MLSVSRKEIKYVIPIEEFARIRNKLESVMKWDENSEMGGYTIRSQYFDSLHDRDLADKLFGHEEKRKIRLRIYSTEDEIVKLEYKGKSDADGLKLSILISREEALQMENHQYSFLLNREEPLAKQLYVKMMQGCYRPKTIVTYKRIAFSYPASNVRITFDTEVMATMNPYGLFKKDLVLAPIQDFDVGVLEVKYDNYLPSPLKMLIDHIDSSTQANGKYAEARLRFAF